MQSSACSGCGTSVPRKSDKCVNCPHCASVPEKFSIWKVLLPAIGALLITGTLVITLILTGCSSQPAPHGDPSQAGTTLPGVTESTPQPTQTEPQPTVTPLPTEPQPTEPEPTEPEPTEPEPTEPQPTEPVLTDVSFSYHVSWAWNHSPDTPEIVLLTSREALDDGNLSDDEATNQAYMDAVDSYDALFFSENCILRILTKQNSLSVIPYVSSVQADDRGNCYIHLGLTKPSQLNSQPGNWYIFLELPKLAEGTVFHLTYETVQVESLSYESACIRADALAAQSPAMPPVVIRSKEELTAYCQANQSIFDLVCGDTVSGDPSLGFLAYAESLDEAFFEEYVLVLLNRPSSGLVSGYDVSAVNRSADGSISIHLTALYEMEQSNHRNWHIAVILEDAPTDIQVFEDLPTIYHNNYRPVSMDAYTVTPGYLKLQGCDASHGQNPCEAPTCLCIVNRITGEHQMVCEVPVLYLQATFECLYYIRSDTPNQIWCADYRLNTNEVIYTLTEATVTNLLYFGLDTEGFLFLVEDDCRISFVDLVTGERTVIYEGTGIGELISVYDRPDPLISWIIPGEGVVYYDPLMEELVIPET